MTFSALSAWEIFEVVAGLSCLLAGAAILIWDIWMAVKEEKEIGDEAGKQD